MKSITKNFAKKVLKTFDIEIMKSATLEEICRARSSSHDIKILQRLSDENAKHLLHYFAKSKSQIRQDLFALVQLNFKRGGYFVEFGATNGLDLSNTHLLEKELGWSGILAEPAKCWHQDLKKNRNCNIETACVWTDSKSVLTFNQANLAELSTINVYSSSDTHKESRKKGEVYDVKTISLVDLLKKYDAPKNIEYLSIDTEGSEFEILSHFNFKEYHFEVITCEHNYTPMREKLKTLLERNGYTRVFEELSLWDDWYIGEKS